MNLNPFTHAKRFTKPYSKALSVKYRDFRARTEAAPRAGSGGPGLFRPLFVDHHVFRAIYLNRHKIAPGVWRSAQPSPGQIAGFARKGIKTIVNLRGERDCGSYRLEVEACRRHGIKLVNFTLRCAWSPPWRSSTSQEALQ